MTRRPPRVAIVFGTRPEAIKLAPIIHEARRTGAIDATVVAAAQHREILDQVLDLFEIRCDHDLDLMRPHQTLPDLTGRVLRGMTGVLERERPDLLMIQGDTTTAMAASLAGFYQRVPVAHVEAGLRSDDLQAPWPEELNRRIASLTAHLHFAPTERARRRLRSEGIEAAAICVSGNTVIDALYEIKARLQASPGLVRDVSDRFSGVPADRPLVLATCHRREAWGQGLENVCLALRTLAERHRVTVVYPVHPNSRVFEPVHRLLGGTPNILLVEPLDYLHFVYLLDRCTLVLTDSGGVQEEAPALGKPVLVMRETTERPEGIDAGVAQLVGTSTGGIVAAAERLFLDPLQYASMVRGVSPYGDGHASGRVVEFIRQWWERTGAETGVLTDSLRSR